MSEMNPYQAPEARAAAVATTAAGNSFLADGRAVDAGQGWEWIASGFRLFKKQPGAWILTLIVWVVCSVLLSLVPLVGALANMLLMPVFSAGMMLGCRALDQDEDLEVAHLFAGFKQNTSDLVVLGVLTLVGWVVVLVPVMLLVGGGAFFAMMRGDPGSLAAAGVTFLLAFLIGLALSIPLYMAIWFAPALVVFNQLKPVEAMKASFFACLKNIIPFLVYGVIVLVLAVIAAIPLGLGFLVLLPVILASVYTAYRDIFFAASGK